MRSSVSSFLTKLNDFEMYPCCWYISCLVILHCLVVFHHKKVLQLVLFIHVFMGI